MTIISAVRRRWRVLRSPRIRDRGLSTPEGLIILAAIGAAALAFAGLFGETISSLTSDFTSSFSGE